MTHCMEGLPGEALMHLTLSRIMVQCLLGKSCHLKMVVMALLPFSISSKCTKLRSIRKMKKTKVSLYVKSRRAIRRSEVQVVHILAPS